MHCNLRARLVVAAAAVLVCIACTDGAADASIDASQSDWQALVLEDCGIAIRLPPGYAEKQWAVTIGSPVIRTFRASDLREIRIEVRQSMGSKLEANRVVRQDDYEEYAESAEIIGGRRAVIQRYRRNGSAAINGQPVPMYRAIAIWQAEPEHVLSVEVKGTTREAQSEGLAVIHSITFLPERGAASLPR